MNTTLVKALVDQRQVLQKARIGFGLRVGAIDRGVDTADETQRAELDAWHQRFAAMEDDIDEYIRESMADHPVVQVVSQIKGVGIMTGAKLVAMIDIHKAPTISALWRYAGQAVVDGERERPRKGEKLHYNARLKTTCFLIGSQMLRANSPYRRIYDEAKIYYQANRSDWTKGHIHMAAQRKMIKVFLSHLWLTWRRIENLPISDPYIIGHDNHSHVIHPEEFGWKADLGK